MVFVEENQPVTFYVHSISVPTRLVGSPDGLAGRLEIFYDGEWGTVCDEGFGADEARFDIYSYI